jgi:hypothetical protein
MIMITFHIYLIQWWLCVFLIQFLACFGGHEVLYGVRLDSVLDVQPHELAIIQFDTRPLGSYWNVSAHWNHAYSLKHGHQYAYFTLTAGKECSRKGVALYSAWCKVKAMLKAHQQLPSAKAFLYLDSDAVITTQLNYSMTDVLAYIRQNLDWNLDKQPMAFNQDGPGWACKHVIESTGYDFCLNSGTVYWRRSFVSQRILTDWWSMALDTYSSHRFSQKWREVWPWEQAPMHKLYDQYRDFVMRLSFPNLTHLPWTSLKNPSSQYPTDFVEPWCFSHWPGANCFITHFCSSIHQKKRMMREFVVHPEQMRNALLKVRFI